jgi:hypothetical protein
MQIIADFEYLKTSMQSRLVNLLGHLVIPGALDLKLEGECFIEV